MDLTSNGETQTINKNFNNIICQILIDAMEKNKVVKREDIKVLRGRIYNVK